MPNGFCVAWTIPGCFKNINLLPSSDGKLESELNLGTLLVQYFFLSHIFFTVYFHYTPPKKNSIFDFFLE